MGQPPRKVDPTESFQQARTWQVRSARFELGSFPRLMGIVNVTPDSFSDGGRFFDSEAAVRHALKLADEGADFLDVGGESTRPGSQPVSLDEELKRVIPVIQRVAAQTDVPISVDTTKAEVASRAIEAGAGIVNDVSGLTFDPEMPAVCRDTNVGVICMHMQGTPQTMQDNPQYEDVVQDICNYLAERLQTLESQGIPRERIVIDPGIGFGKRSHHNLEILSHIGRFHELGRPVLIGHSRKRFLQKVLGREQTMGMNPTARLDERLAGTVGLAIALAEQQVDILRVHDVGAVRDALLAWQAVWSARSASGTSTRGAS